MFKWCSGKFRHEEPNKTLLADAALLAAEGKAKGKGKGKISESSFERKEKENGKGKQKSIATAVLPMPPMITNGSYVPVASPSSASKATK